MANDPRRDPTYPPQRRMKSLGVTVPPLANVKDTVIAEATKTRVSVSLLLLGACIVASYIAGQQSGAGVTEAQVQAIVDGQTAQTRALVESLRSINETAQKTQGQVTAIDSRLSTQAGQLEVIRSHVVEGRRPAHP